MSSIIIYCRELNIEFVVAPYEADAQLAYLASLPPWKGGVEAVITEDGDLVAYGCRTILFKCDMNGGAQELTAEAMYAGADIVKQDVAAEGNKGGNQQQQQQQLAGSISGTTNTTSSNTTAITVSTAAVGGTKGGKASGKGAGGPKAKVVCFKGWNLELTRAACVLAG